MTYVLPKFASHLGSLGIVTCAAGSNALAGLSGHLNEIVVNLIGDCIGKQVLQAVPVLASAGSDGLNFASIAIELVAALIGGGLIAIVPRLVSRSRSPRTPAVMAIPA
jgi:hypothetical protein